MIKPEKSINRGNIAPLISIITVVFNGKQYLEQTIQSVINQSYQSIEYIIIDGGSTDGSLDIIKKHDNKINTWISEEDKGIAEAMNKGIGLATGDYILFLHSDDYFPNPDIIMDASRLFNDDYDLLIFDMLFGKNQIRVRPGRFGFWFRFRHILFHQGIICRRELFKKIGLFDINLKISMDYEWLLRAYYRKCSIKYSPIILSMMRDTGISSKTDWHGLKQRFNEEKLAQYRHCHTHLDRTLHHLFWLFYTPFRFLKANLVT